MNTSTDIAALKNRIPILSLIGQGVTLKQDGREWLGLCPFHQENTPSFRVNPDKGEFHCFGCGKGGDAISYTQLAHNMTFPEALHYLQERWGSAATIDTNTSSMSHANPSPLPTGPQRPATDASPAQADWTQRLRGGQEIAGTPGEDYLRTRSISSLFATASRMRYHPRWFAKPEKRWYGRPAIIYPLIDPTRGKDALVAAEGRYIDGKEKTDKTKYHKAQIAGPKGAGIFITPEALTQTFLIITEGPIDALSLAECGIPAIATCSAQNQPPFLAALCRGKTVWTAFDPDTAGSNGTQTLAATLATAGIQSHYLRPPEGMDWNDCLCVYGRRAMQSALAEHFPNIRVIM